jgi:anti-anti-sigma regulatory factor
MLSPPDLIDAAPAAIDRALRLPAHCTTVTAEDTHVRLVLAADFDETIEVDASQVESIGQATLQLLIAARADAVANGRHFAIVDASPAFVDRVTKCRLAEAIGLESQKEYHA